MRRTARILLGAIAAVGSIIALPQRDAAAAMPQPSDAADQFVRLLNQTRMDHGLSSLQRDAGLDGVADDWAHSMRGVWNTVLAVNPQASPIDPGAPKDCT